MLSAGANWVLLIAIQLDYIGNGMNRISIAIYKSLSVKYQRVISGSLALFPFLHNSNGPLI